MKYQNDLRVNAENYYWLKNLLGLFCTIYFAEEELYDVAYKFLTLVNYYYL